MPLSVRRKDDLRYIPVGEVLDWRDLQARYDCVGATVPNDGTIVPIMMVQAGAPRVPRHQDINLMEILRECLKDKKIEFVWKYQRSGTCVGCAAALCCDIAQVVSWLLFDEEFAGRTSVAVCYTGSRVEVAGRPGSWQGSNGVWAAEFVRKWGVGLLWKVGLDETATVADERLALQWTASRSGIPEQFETLARDHPILQTPAILTTQEAAIALEAGSPIICCSSLIPIGKTNRNGISPVRKSGGHAITIGGVRWRGDQSEWLYVNSWSENWGDGGSVWIKERDLQSMLDYKDSFAFAGVGGLQPQKL